MAKLTQYSKQCSLNKPRKYYENKLSEFESELKKYPNKKFPVEHGRIQRQVSNYRAYLRYFDENATMANEIYRMSLYYNECGIHVPYNQLVHMAKDIINRKGE